MKMHDVTENLELWIDLEWGPGELVVLLFWLLASALTFES